MGSLRFDGLEKLFWCVRCMIVPEIEYSVVEMTNRFERVAGA